MRSRLFFFILILSLLGCGSMKEVSKSEDKTEKPAQIVFHNFLAVNDNGTVIIEEKDRFLTDGQIKDLESNSMGMLYPVEVDFEKANNRVLKSIYIEHPLIDVLEYAADQDQIKRVIIYRDSATFTLRYNYIDELMKISFSTDGIDTLNIRTNLELKK